METSLILNEMSCRYCLSTENEGDFISPCKCTGSARYVHCKCLKEWYKTINNRVIVPGRFNSFNFKCEICHTPYKVVYKKTKNETDLYREISLYVFTISLSLFLSYLSIGLLMSLRHATIVDMESFWKNVFLNGFIVTHIILTVFYITTALIVNTDNSCCWIGDCSSIDYSGDCMLVFLIFLVAISIIGTILIVYFDILSRLSQRHYNNSLVIEEIKNYE